jgi:hypothetical protein
MSMQTPLWMNAFEALKAIGKLRGFVNHQEISEAR